MYLKFLVIAAVFLVIFYSLLLIQFWNKRRDDRARLRSAHEYEAELEDRIEDLRTMLDNEIERSSQLAATVNLLRAKLLATLALAIEHRGKVSEIVSREGKEGSNGSDQSTEK